MYLILIFLWLLLSAPQFLQHLGLGSLELISHHLVSYPESAGKVAPGYVQVRLNVVLKRAGELDEVRIGFNQDACSVEVAEEMFVGKVYSGLIQVPETCRQLEYYLQFNEATEARKVELRLPRREDRTFTFAAGSCAETGSSSTVFSSIKKHDP